MEILIVPGFLGMSKHKNSSLKNTSLISIKSIAIKKNISYRPTLLRFSKNGLINTGVTYNIPLRTVKVKLKYIPKALKPNKGGKQ